MISKKELKKCLLENDKEEIIEQYLETTSKLNKIEKCYATLEDKYYKLIAKNGSLQSKIESLEEDVEYWKEKYKELEDSLNSDYDPEIEIPEIHGEGISW